jgi:hypothetical protein
MSHPDFWRMYVMRKPLFESKIGFFLKENTWSGGRPKPRPAANPVSAFSALAGGPADRDSFLRSPDCAELKQE